ncbi:AAA family ATPase [Kitasatospora sp. CB01950]|uniref:AAA family ATPase n=1 Tax=Kitasatospora sp. CB01950 TaxID=1703930 RepID=UPI00093E4174|nr:AAA family ATPase [Kitasatospora sp. CB01950]OKJ07424.1 transcriptional regulator [Kitasatospora sp. CB01950]
MSLFQHALVIGKFYPPHAGHHFLIRSAADAAERVTVVVMAADSETIPLDDRVRWIREVWRGDSQVRVVGTVDNIPVDYQDPEIWDGHVALMREALRPGESIDAVFSSEEYGYELARRFDAAPVVLDVDRATFPVSGTEVRADPAAHWADLEPAVRAGLARRVIVLGAESTGTTTLSLDLARALRARGGVHALTGWVAEYGRELTASKLAVARGVAATAGDPMPTVDQLEWDGRDFALVRKRQAEAEERAARAGGPVLVCDTDLLATAVWEERYCGRTAPETWAAVATQARRELYVLTSHEGVAFEDDGLRDGEHLREWMSGRFREVLGASGQRWIEVRGSREERVEAVLRALFQGLGEELLQGFVEAPPTNP